MGCNLFTEFYCDASTGSNTYAGDKTANGVITSTNGAWSTVTNIFTATGGTPFSGVSIGDFCALMVDGGTVAVYVARVTAIGLGGLTLTLSSTAKSGTAPTTAGIGITATTGGAWKGPNGAVNFPFGFLTNALKNSNSDIPRVNIKNNSTYSVTAAVSHSSSGPVTWQGYSSTVGDGGKAIIDGGTSGVSYVLLSLGAVSHVLKDVIFQNNGATGSASGVLFSSIAVVQGCVVNSVRGKGFELTAAVTILECEAYSCNQSNTALFGGFYVGASGVKLFRCISHDNAGSNSSGFSVQATASLAACVADTNGQYGFLWSTSNSGPVFQGCTAYNNVSDGINGSASSCVLVVENCLLISNGTGGTGYGVNLSTQQQMLVSNNAFYGNNTGQANGVNASLVTGSITLTSDPFTAASTGDFTLNNTAGAGAACRNTGRGTFTETQASYTGTISYPDVGAIQNQVTPSPIFSRIRTGY